MSKIDELIKEAEKGGEYYDLYNKQREIVDKLRDDFEIKVGGLRVTFKYDGDKLIVFFGSVNLTREDAITLAEGLLERLR